MHSIKDRIQNIQQNIGKQCQQSQRKPSDVELLAVSKRFDQQAVLQAHHSGLQHFAENYVQEGVDKVQALADYKLTWHFIGPLQSNKTKAVAQHFDWVHSIERLKIAQRLNAQRPEQMPPLNVLLQINISADQAKSGLCSQQQQQQRQLAVPEQALYKIIKQLADNIQSLPNLRLRGLMAITEAQLSTEQLSLQFAHLSQLYKQLQLDFDHIDSLSMGMSGDYTTAIDCGSTMIRIGTALFGQRTT